MASQTVKGKMAIVTGASRNLGRAFSEMLRTEGAVVAAHFNSPTSKAGAEETAAPVKAAGGNAASFQAYLTKVKEVERFFDDVTNKFRGLDIPINATSRGLKKSFVEITEHEYDRRFAINAKAAFFCMREAAKRMRDSGRVLNLGTSLPAATTGFYPAAAGSKAPLENITRALAKEVGGGGICVQTIFINGGYLAR
jgi:NAD(P)-dependent dehydrogenase (short-subunit alcohol dehydrogenase family)